MQIQANIEMTITFFAPVLSVLFALFVFHLSSTFIWVSLCLAFAQVLNTRFFLLLVIAAHAHHSVHADGKTQTGKSYSALFKLSAKHNCRYVYTCGFPFGTVPYRLKPDVFVCKRYKIWISFKMRIFLNWTIKICF